MSSLLHYGEQAFWVSNGIKDLLYEVVLEMAKRGNPAAHKRLQEDGRLIGCYEVSGLGFDLEAFEECFGGKENFKKTVTDHIGVVDEMCGPHERCIRLMKKLFDWTWYLLDGGRCNDPSGRHPGLDDVPETPG